jgi:hypothetical protein
MMNEENINTGQSDVPILDAETVHNNEIVAAHDLMLKEIRSWSYWSLGLGVLHLISSGFLNASWGILLILVGLASFYFRTAVMFVIYAVTLAWAALSNISSFNAGWGFFALFQLYLAFTVFKQYRRFRQAEIEFIALPSNNSQKSALLAARTSRWFPWVGPVFGCFSMVSVVVSIALAAILISINGDTFSNPPFLFSLIVGFIELFAVLGIAVSLASLLSGYRPKALPISGLVIGGIMMVLWFLSTFGLI